MANTPRSGTYYEIPVAFIRTEAFPEGYWTSAVTPGSVYATPETARDAANHSIHLDMVYNQGSAVLRWLAEGSLAGSIGNGDPIWREILADYQSYQTDRPV